MKSAKVLAVPRPPARVSFRKTVTVLAVAFGIASGLCGLNFLAVYTMGRASIYPPMPLILTAYAESAVMIFSAAGLLLCLLWWAISRVARHT